MSAPVAFPLLEATIDVIHQAYKARQLTARQLVQLYLDRIEADAERACFLAEYDSRLVVCHP